MAPQRPRKMVPCEPSIRLADGRRSAGALDAEVSPSAADEDHARETGALPASPLALAVMFA